MPELIRVFVIGDSISIQYGPYLERYLPENFTYSRKIDAGGEKAEANLDIPTGANGGDSRMVLEYMRQRREHAPIVADVLVLNCGLHDIKTDLITGDKQVAIGEYEGNLRAIVAESKPRHIVWVRTTPVIDAIHNQPGASFHRHASDVYAYNKVADLVMTKAGATIVDLHSFSKKFSPEGFCDHVHFKEEIRALQGAFLAGILSGSLSV